MPRLTVASFNVHAGIDGWGRPFDVVPGCRAAEADVLVMQENFRPDDGESVASAVASALGYEVVEVPLERAWRLSAPPGAREGWLPRKRDRQISSLRVGRKRVAGRKRSWEAGRTLEDGMFGFAVLTRLPIVATRKLDLGRLRRDYLPRAALSIDLSMGGTDIRVTGTHMSHLVHGSAMQYRRLARLLGPTREGLVEVLAGDMNLWGPVVSAFLPGWRRVVRGRSFPAWRPLAGIDHVLVRGGAASATGEVLADAGSDHRPVRAVIEV